MRKTSGRSNDGGRRDEHTHVGGRRSVARSSIDSRSSLVAEPKMLERSTFQNKRVTLDEFQSDDGPDRRRLRELSMTVMLNETMKFLSFQHAASRKESQEERDSLDQLEFDKRPYLGFRYPMLERLDSKSLLKFKRELEAAEELRREWNMAKPASRQVPSPTPRLLILKRHWALVAEELRQVNPSIGHFLDASFEDLENWLTRVCVPVPNNRPFIRRLNEKLSKAWAESYLFGLNHVQDCLPIRSSRTYTEDNIIIDPAFFDETEPLKTDTAKPSKKLSTTSSVSMFSFGSKKSSRLSEDLFDETIDIGMLSDDEEHLEYSRLQEAVQHSALKSVPSTLSMKSKGMAHISATIIEETPEDIIDVQPSGSRESWPDTKSSGELYAISNDSHDDFNKQDSHDDFIKPVEGRISSICA